MNNKRRNARKSTTMLDFLVNCVGSLGYWGYLVIFFAVALECQAVLGLAMPGESLVLVGGFLAGQGVFDPAVLLLVIALAAIFGDSIGYQLGRLLGREWLLHSAGRFGLRHDHLHRVDRFLARHGGKVVFSSHFLHLFRSLMPFVAGSQQMPYGRFFMFNAMGCVVWAGIFVVFGYLTGKNWQVATEWIGDFGKILAATLIVVFMFVWFQKRLGKLKRT